MSTNKDREQNKLEKEEKENRRKRKNILKRAINPSGKM